VRTWYYTGDRAYHPDHTCHDSEEEQAGIMFRTLFISMARLVFKRGSQNLVTIQQIVDRETDIPEQERV
jgi:hypothetical protein